jgi:excinuclease ABC subunit C
MAAQWGKILPIRDMKKLPETPGVYFFLDENKAVLYIGKATSLRDRVKSYFARDIGRTPGPKIALMLGRASLVAYRRSDSVLEALILESNLIKSHQPPYNTDAKDDKSYNHVVITKEKVPRVLMVRGRDIERQKFTEPVKYAFGPFPSGGGCARR